MNAEELRKQLREVFGAQITFNKNFDLYAMELKERMQDEFLTWCKAIKENEIAPLRSRKNKVLVFVRKIGSTNRCIVIKIVNDNFKEVHLADHDYYNSIMQNLGLKKSSNMY